MSKYFRIFPRRLGNAIAKTYNVQKRTQLHFPLIYPKNWVYQSHNYEKFFVIDVEIKKKVAMKFEFYYTYSSSSESNTPEYRVLEAPPHDLPLEISC